MEDVREHYRDSSKLAKRQALFEFGDPARSHGPGLLDVIDWSGHEVVLDAGCGNGVWTGAVAPPVATVVGLDTSLGMLNDIVELSRACPDSTVPGMSSRVEGVIETVVGIAVLVAFVIGFPYMVATEEPTSPHEIGFFETAALVVFGLLVALSTTKKRGEVGGSDFLRLGGLALAFSACVLKGLSTFEFFSRYELRFMLTIFPVFFGSFYLVAHAENYLRRFCLFVRQTAARRRPL